MGGQLLPINESLVVVAMGQIMDHPKNVLAVPTTVPYFIILQVS